ncbi:MAG TPA: hypothetical protein VKR31_00850 [Rhizomicrobium sp.]|nr:hypothetical protein [Rhizomicrobium sp.]
MLKAVETQPFIAPPKVTLAGAEYEIPVLAPKQNRIVVPLIDSVFPKIENARRKSFADPADEKKGVVAYRWMVELVLNGAYDDLCAVTHAALTRTLPDLTRAEFDDWAVDTFELLAAVAVIARQAGLIRDVVTATKPSA